MVFLLVSTTETKQLFDDWPWEVVHTLTASIKVGEKMKGKTIEEFQPGKNFIEPAGVIDNHSKWPIRLYDREEGDGTITVPLNGAPPGTREVFASRKNNYALLGSEVSTSKSISYVPYFHLFSNFSRSLDVKIEIVVHL